jgi:predicted phosphodiesterase
MIGYDRAVMLDAEAESEGDAWVKQKYNLTSESLRRYRNHARKLRGENKVSAFDTETKILKDIRDRYTDAELQAISKGGRHKAVEAIDADWFDGDTLTIGVISDTHIGSKYFREDWYDGALDRFDHHNVDCIMHVGDLSEGMSNRPGHIYELSHIGYTAQRDECVTQLSKTDKPIYIISGNHDRWHIKANGADIIQDVCDRLDNVTFCGHDTGDVYISGIHVQLWHGEDSSSYALSYRLQKVIEALPGGRKPNLLLAGHVHKMGYFFIRNVHAISAGSIQEQTPFLRGKRIEVHPGFWVLEMDINDGSIVRFTPTYYPYY